MSHLIDSFVSAARAQLRSHRAAALVVALIAPALAAAVLVCALAPSLGDSERVPVAVVNLDEGARNEDGAMVRAGEDLVDQLEDTSTLAWSVVDEQAADDGLADGTYALALKIPEDYSECVASLSGSSPTKATVEIVSTGSENVLATRAGSAALQQVQARLRSDLGEDYLLSVLNDVQSQASRLTLTSDGSVMLDAGYDALEQGADAIASGLEQTASGADQLGSGLGQIADGVAAAGSGAAALGKGLAAISDQAATPLAQGAEALVSGLDTISETTQTMGAGVEQVGSALSSLSDTLGSGMDSVSELGFAGKQIATEGLALTQALSGATTSLDGAADAVASAASAATSAVELVASPRCALSEDTSLQISPAALAP